MSGQANRLFDLLPAVYRVADGKRGGELSALLGVIEEELERLEGDIEGLYDNWFIETCDEWVVPYIGDLLGVHGLASVEDGVFSQRAFVANTLAYRRGKGTAAVLEQLARDVTGWPAKAVEYFELLATTRAMNHARRSDVSTLEVRDANRAELVAAPLEEAAHTAEVRNIDNGRGRYSIRNVGLHLWRLQPYYVARGTARPVRVRNGRAGRFTFDPTRRSAPLFNVPRAETATTQLAAEATVPGRLRRRPLHDELDARRQALVDGDEPEELFFDVNQPVVRIWIEREDDGGPFMDEVLPEEILVCNLSDRPRPDDGWRRPPNEVRYVPTGGGPTAWRRIKVGIDPVLGRLALPIAESSPRVEVAYAYGFPGDLGAGPYSRRASAAEALELLGKVDWQMGVTTDGPAGAEGMTSSLGEAVAEWNTLDPGAAGVIAVMDSRTYREDVEIEIKAESRLLIVAADWPPDPEPDELGRERRSRGRLTADGRRPHVRGRVRVRGSAPAGGSPGLLALDGLLIEGSVAVLPGNLGTLRVAHCTIVPRAGRLLVDGDASDGKENNRLDVSIVRSVTGAVRVDARVAGVRVLDSVVEGRGGPAVVAPETEIAASTILGETSVRSLYASNTIFTGLVKAERLQTGCVRYSFLPRASRVPRRFRCHPRDVAAEGHVAPAFTSTEYGHPAYVQLARSCPPELTQGADDEGELGAFHFLHQPKRVANLTSRLDEYLRFGLEAGVFFVT